MAESPAHRSAASASRRDLAGLVLPAEPPGATVEMKSPHRRRRHLMMRALAVLALAYAVGLMVIEGRTADHRFCTFMSDTIVTASGPARAAGLRPGDRIVRIDGRKYAQV